MRSSVRSRSARRCRSIVTGEAGRRSGGGRKGARRGTGAIPARRARRRRSSTASARLTTRTSRAASSASTASAASRTSSPRARCSAARRISTRRGSTGSRRRRRPTCRAPRSAGCPTACSCSTSSPCRRTRPSASTVDRSKLPATGTPPSLKLPAPQRAKLSNGLEVVLVERHNAPVVDFTLIADAGFAADSPGQARHRASRHADAAGGHEDPQLAARSPSARSRSARRWAWARRWIART